MKKALSLILALILCLSLCACGGGNNTSDTQNKDNADISPNENNNQADLGNSNTSVSENPDSAEFLFWKQWTCYNLPEFTTLFFYEDGSANYFSEGENCNWTLQDDILEITGSKYCSDTYKVIHSNGNYYLIGNTYTLIENYDLPTEEVAITTENWKDFFEIVEITSEYQEKDQFGDPVGEVITETRTFLQLKPEYAYRNNNESTILIRYSVDGNEHDVSVSELCANVGSEYIQFSCAAELIDGITIDQIQMIRIEGTLFLLAGI